MTMILDDRHRRRGAHLAREPDSLRDCITDLRSVVRRMDAVLDRMEEQQEKEADDA